LEIKKKKKIKKYKKKKKKNKKNNGASVYDHFVQMIALTFQIDLFPLFFFWYNDSAIIL
jgi:hypothetical protein